MQAFVTRAIEGDWPDLWIDAASIKVRQNGRIVAVSVAVAVGVNADGRREVQGLAVGPSEAETLPALTAPSVTDTPSSICTCASTPAEPKNCTDNIDYLQSRQRAFEAPRAFQAASRCSASSRQTSCSR